MSFKVKDCAIPTIWCGKGAPPKRKDSDLRYYHKTGSRYECMKQGWGAGAHSVKRESLPSNSLQQIKYVGDAYEKKFKAQRIANIDQLLSKARNSSKIQLQTLLRRVFIRKKGGLDKRAYNSTLIYLYQHGVSQTILPACSKI